MLAYEKLGEHLSCGQSVGQVFLVAACMAGQGMGRLGRGVKLRGCLVEGSSSILYFLKSFN